MLSNKREINDYDEPEFFEASPEDLLKIIIECPRILDNKFLMGAYMSSICSPNKKDDSIINDVFIKCPIVNLSRV
jgi:hypothetical protein